MSLLEAQTLSQNGTIYSPDVFIGAHQGFNSRRADLSCRQDEIKCIWQRKDRRTIVTVLFVFVGTSTSLIDRSLHLHV